MNTLRKYPIHLTVKEIQDKASMKKMGGRLDKLPIYGGELVAPVVNSLGLNEISIEDFAPYQQYLAANAKEQTQSLSTLGTAGKVIDTVQKIGSLIPGEIGEVVGIANQAYNFLIGLFYHPHISIQNKLKDEGIDIFLDDVYIINPQYPDDKDPKHYEILMPNGTTATIQDQARYICLMFYLTVLGHYDKWITKISDGEREYMFPSNNAQWPIMFEQLSIVHGHGNEYLVK